MGISEKSVAWPKRVFFIHLGSCQKSQTHKVVDTDLSVVRRWPWASTADGGGVNHIQICWERIAPPDVSLDRDATIFLREVFNHAQRDGLHRKGIVIRRRGKRWLGNNGAVKNTLVAKERLPIAQLWELGVGGDGEDTGEEKLALIDAVALETKIQILHFLVQMLHFLVDGW